MLLAALSVVLSMALPSSVFAREQIRIVGSSTVFPFANTVAEKFGLSRKFKTPIVESTGTGSGFKLFCAGVGIKYPDITNASRAIKKSESEDCAKNGVKDIAEFKIGYDGIVLANAKTAPKATLTRKQIFLALAKTVPIGGKLVANPYARWSDIDPKLPNTKIEVLGPPPTSGTRDSFVEMVMEAACDEFPEIAALKASPDEHAKACKNIREDGAFIEAGENDNLIVQKLAANRNAFGVFGFSFLDQNTDKVQGALVDGVAPSFESIAEGQYPISRPLFFYVKQAHVGAIPGLPEFTEEFVSERAMGEEGYLALKGLVPLRAAERQAIRDTAGKLKSLAM
jgi:phosphate transport system substrate-binding protein